MGELVKKGELDEAGKAKVIKELDQLASEVKIISTPGGKGYLGGQRLGRSQIRIWIKYIDEISNGKASIKIVEEGDILYNKLIRNEARAGFDPETMEIVVMKGFTEFEIFHEAQHLEEFLKIGKEEYVRGMRRYGGDYVEDRIRYYKRELYVYNRIMEVSKKFNKEELKKSKSIIINAEKELKLFNIDISKIKVE